MLYRIQHGLVDIPKEKYLHSRDSRTRGQHRFFQERIYDDNYKNSFFPRTVRDWNQLPARVVLATSLEEFRSLLRGRSTSSNYCRSQIVNSFKHAQFFKLYSQLARLSAITMPCLSLNCLWSKKTPVQYTEEEEEEEEV